MDPNGNGKRGLPKFRDLSTRQRQDSESGPDCPDIEFNYNDSDTLVNEIAELYSYSEQPEFRRNFKAFEEQMKDYKLGPFWLKFSDEQRKSVVAKLLDQCEVCNRATRMKAARCILYLAQGCWAELHSDTEQQDWSRKNVLLLYECGVFGAFVELLNMEIENITAALKNLTFSLEDSIDLRVVLNVLYTMIEVIRFEPEDEEDEGEDSDGRGTNNVREAFKSELSNPLGDELLVVKLFGIVTRFCNGAVPYFPMKKVLLILWKTILFTLGGMETLRQLKRAYREKYGLSVSQDTMEVARTMRASSPPTSATDLLEAQNQKRNISSFRRGILKQNSLDDGMGFEGNDQVDDEGREFEEREIMGEFEVSQHPSSRHDTRISIKRKGLPWTPKARQEDLDQFLENTRMKFVGFPLHGDRVSLVGLPEPIREGVSVLKQNMYISLSEIQIKQEENISRNPISAPEGSIPLTPAEILYQGMLPNMYNYMIALLHVLFRSTPISKANIQSINTMSDVLPEELPISILQSILGIDDNRRKEIVIKAVSGILLLLLKHFKLNHVYQFEFASQHLVCANCINLLLMFFNQKIMAYVGAKNTIPIMEFPSCVIGVQPKPTAESLDLGDQSFSWRNIFSCINLSRVLNKLTKWKHYRIMKLVDCKSAPILKRALKVRHAMLQLYVLKLLKMQTKYLGRQWRKSNMKTMSAIYQKVRHRLNDDWAYGNDLDARFSDIKAEEDLRACVDRFNNRRYNSGSRHPDFEPSDTCSISVLGQPFELSEYFKQHYEVWLRQEVFGGSFGENFD